MQLPGPFGKWMTPRYITIHDSRLGGLYWFLRIGVVVYVLITVFNAGSYRWSETPDGAPTFWFESGDLYAAQDQEQLYCGSSEYDYQYSEDKKSYWNDENIQCEALHYGQVTMKTASSGFVITYVKEEETYSRPCVKSEDACLPYMDLGLITSEDMVTRNQSIRGPKGKDRTCTCAKLNNYFVHGAEKLELHVDHSFWATQKMDIAGSSTYEGIPEDPEEKLKRKNIKTCLKKKDMKEGECFQEFEPGETMKLRLHEWMELAGVTLDERLTGTVTQDKATGQRNGQYPYRRQVGATLLIKLMYKGDANNDDTFTCNVEVEAQDGWTSIGSEVTYADYESQQKMHFYDRYRRGVEVTFSPMGQVTQFDYVTMMNTIIQGLVLLSLCEHIVKIVASYALPESPQYLRSFNQPFKLKKELATFSVNVALACQAFNAWDTGNKKGEKPLVSEKELMEVFKKNFDGEVSAHFADVIMEVAREYTPDIQNGVTLDDLVHIISSGVVSIEELMKLKTTTGLYEDKVAPSLADA